MIDRGALANTQSPINRAHPLVHGLVSWWLAVPQWYGGNKLYDLCGLNPGTLTGMTSTGGWRPSVRPGGYGDLLFDGSDDYVDCGSPVALNQTGQMTACCWFKVVTSTSNRALLVNCNAAGAASNWAFTSSFGGNNKIQFWNNATGPLVTGATTLTAGQWYFGAAVRAGSPGSWTLNLYLNGVSDGSATTSTPPSGGTYPVSIGRFGGFGGYYQSGSIDGPMLYSRALSAAEVFALYNEGRRGYPGLLRRWEWGQAGATWGWQFQQGLRQDKVVAVSYR